MVVASEDTCVPEVAVTTEESHVVEDHAVGRCCVCKSEENVRRCGKCNITLYCSKQCQVSHFSQHKN